MMIYHLAQTQTPAVPPSPIPQSLFEGSIAVAIVIFILREGLTLFKKKDADEATLIGSLIQDLRTERTEQLQQMQRVLLQLHGSNRQVAIAVQNMSKAISDINLTHQQQARTNTEIFHTLRQQQQVLVAVSEKIDRVINEQNNGATRNHPSQSESRPHV
jgi:hypothetical protein